MSTSYYIWPNEVHFGYGTVAKVGPSAKAEGATHVFVLADPGVVAAKLVDPILASLQNAGLAYTLYDKVEPNPSDTSVDAAVAAYRASGADLIVGVGGGSGLDTAKALMLVAGGPADAKVAEYAYRMGDKARPCPKVLPSFIAIPTTAGTGAEVTRNAVLSSPENRVKVSLRSPRMLPRIALVDPELCRSVPPEVTATTGLDALTQLLEAFVSVRATPFTDALCRDALPRVGRSLHRAWRDGQDLGARCEMSLAALSSGLALANAGLGVVHGFAGPLGGMTGAAHGALCSALLEPVTRVNLAALRQRMPASPAIDRYAEAMRLLGGPDSLHPEAFPDFLAEWTHPFALSDLAALGAHADDFLPLLPRVLAASSTRGNPIELTNHELDRIFQAAMSSGRRPPPPSRETLAGVRDVGDEVR